MTRNKTTRRENFGEKIIQLVWEKAETVPEFDPAAIRKDRCGALIGRQFFNDPSSPFGWEIDHIKPVTHGGGDDLVNLQPLQWQNNKHKSDLYPSWRCCVSRRGGKNECIT